MNGIVDRLARMKQHGLGFSLKGWGDKDWGETLVNILSCNSGPSTWPHNRITWESLKATHALASTHVFLMGMRCDTGNQLLLYSFGEERKSKPSLEREHQLKHLRFFMHGVLALIFKNY